MSQQNRLAFVADQAADLFNPVRYLVMTVGVEGVGNDVDLEL